MNGFTAAYMYMINMIFVEGLFALVAGFGIFCPSTLAAENWGP